MSLLAEAIRTSANQTARYHGQDREIVVQQISGREFGDDALSFAVNAVHAGAATRFDADDLLETMSRLIELGIPEAVAQGTDWRATIGTAGVDPQSPAHAW